MKDNEGTSWVNDILAVQARNLFSVVGKIEHKDMVVDKVDIGSVQALAKTLGTEYFCYCVQKEQPDSCLSQQVKKAETACKLERVQGQPSSVAEILSAQSFGLSLYRPYIHVGLNLSSFRLVE